MSFEVTDYGDAIVKDSDGDKLIVSNIVGLESRLSWVAESSHRVVEVYMSKEDWDKFKDAVDRKYRALAMYADQAESQVTE